MQTCPKSLSMEPKSQHAALAGLLIFAFLIRVFPLLRSQGLVSLKVFLACFGAIFVGLATILLVYRIALRINGSPEASLFCAALAAIIPLYSWRLTSDALVSAVATLLFFLILYLFISFKEVKGWQALLALPVFYAVIHPSAWILAPIFLIYIILLKLEHKELSLSEKYFIPVAATIVLLICILVSVPSSISQVIHSAFLHILGISYTVAQAENFTLTEALSLVGALPVLFGMVGAWCTVKQARKAGLLLLSVVAATFILSLIAAKIYGYIFFGVGLSCLAGCCYLGIKGRIRSSRLARFEHVISYLLFLLVLASGILHWGLIAT